MSPLDEAATSFAMVAAVTATGFLVILWAWDRRARLLAQLTWLAQRPDPFRSHGDRERYLNALALWKIRRPIARRYR